MPLKHSVVFHEFLSHEILRKVKHFSVKSTQQRFYLVKMAKIELQNRNFQQFRVELRRPKLNESCRGWFIV